MCFRSLIWHPLSFFLVEWLWKRWSQEAQMLCSITLAAFASDFKWAMHLKRLIKTISKSMPDILKKRTDLCCSWSICISCNCWDQCLCSTDSCCRSHAGCGRRICEGCCVQVSNRSGGCAFNRRGTRNVRDDRKSWHSLLGVRIRQVSLLV